MAVKSKSTSSAPSTKKADGFLNVEVISADGQKYRLHIGIPLSADRRVDASLLRAASMDPEREFTLVGKVWIAPEEGQEPDYIEL